MNGKYLTKKFDEKEIDEFIKSFKKRSYTLPTLDIKFSRHFRIASDQEKPTYMDYFMAIIWESFSTKFFKPSESEKNLLEYYDLILDIVHNFKLPYAAGGVDDTTIDSPTEEIQLLCFKDDKHIDHLQKHFKAKFKLKLSKEEVEELVKESKPTIVKKHGFTLYSWIVIGEFTERDNELYKLLREKNNL